jgi:hypothetical protein
MAMWFIALVRTDKVWSWLVTIMEVLLSNKGWSLRDLCCYTPDATRLLQPISAIFCNIIAGTTNSIFSLGAVLTL